MENFIDEKFLWEHIEKAENPEPQKVRETLLKALEMKGLGLEDAAVLLACEDKDFDEEIFSAARKVKERIYGNRMVLFAPKYITNECANCCSYCGFSTTNKDLEHRTLELDEIRDEVIALADQGHKRLLLVYGEHPTFGPEWIQKTVETVYATQSEKSGEIRRVNINCAPLSVSGFRTMAEAGIGTYQCFQETYHQKTYESVHLKGAKRNYLWRLYAMHRAHKQALTMWAWGRFSGCLITGLSFWAFFPMPCS